MNGFLLGRQHGGSTSFRYDITDYFNCAVATPLPCALTPTWRKAGITRAPVSTGHVWLTKTAPPHVAPWGAFVTADLRNDFSHADITARASIANDGAAAATVQLEQTVLGG